MLKALFFNIDGIVDQEFISQGQTVNLHQYTVFSGIYGKTCGKKDRETGCSMVTIILLKVLTVQEFLVRNLVAVVPHLLHLFPM
jgi:hypothetical protein